MSLAAHSTPQPGGNLVRSFIAWIVWLCLLPAFSAAAQDSAPTSQSVKPAEEIYQEAKVFYDAGEYQEALAGFRQAYKLTKNPEVLQSIGQTYRYLNCYDEAIKAFRGFVDNSPPEKMWPERRATYEQLIEELKRSKVDPRGPTCRLSASERGLIVENPSAEPTTAKNPTTSPMAVMDPQPQPNPKMPKKALFFVGTGVGVAVGLAFGGLAFSASNRAEELTQLGVGESPDPGAVLAEVKKMNTFGALSTGCFVAGLLSGGVGLLLPKPTSTSQVQLSVSPLGATLAVRY